MPRCRILGVRQRLALIDLPTDEASRLRYCILTDGLIHIDRRRRPENRIGFAHLLGALPHVPIRCLYGAGPVRYRSSQRREAVAAEVVYGIFDADGGSSSRHSGSAMTGRLRIRPCFPNRSAVGEWRRLVAHLVWDQGVAGSNPVSPTIIR